MSFFQKYLRRVVVVAMTGLLVSTLHVVPASATCANDFCAPVVVTGGPGGGGWIVGGIFISVASIIACAAIVGAAEDRELTLEEAWLAGLIPLSCLLTAEFGDEE